MDHPAEFPIDEAAVSRWIESRPASLRARLGSGLLVFLAVLSAVVVVPGLAGGEALQLQPMTDRLLPALILAAALSAWTVWRTGRSLAGESVADVSESIRKDWRRVAGPGWVGRMLGSSVAMGLAIGVPVGALLAFGTPADELPGGGRVVVILTFVGLTLAWTVPFAFGLRLLVKRSHRKFVRPA